MRLSFLRSASLFVATLALGSLAGCGGSGGGGTDAPTIPGTLASIALEGASAPGTTGGAYASFGPQAMVSVNDGGWTAFVSGVVGGSTSKGLFVVRPDGTVVDVFLKGQTVPPAGQGTASGTIDDFEKIWITAGGVVVAKIKVLGGVTEAIISARVPTASVPTEKATVVFLGSVLPAGTSGGPPGLLSAFHDDLIQVDEQGDVFFVADAQPSVAGVWTYDRSGVNDNAVAVTSDAAPGGGTLGSDFDGLGIDADGQVVAFAVGTSMLNHALIAKNGPSGTGVVVAKDGDSHASLGGKTFENVYDSGPIYVTYGAGTSFVTWTVDLTGVAPDKAVFTRQVVGGDILGTGSLLAMAIPNQTVPGAGAGAFMTTIRLVDGALDPNRIPLLIDVGLGSTSRVLVSCPNPTTITTVTYQGQVVPDPAETTFTANYPSLLVPGAKCGDFTGTLAFSAQLANGSSGIFWAIYGGGFWDVARQGDPVPGLAGVTFSPFLGTGPVIPASGCLVFQANLTGGTAPTGLFRQR